MKYLDEYRETSAVQALQGQIASSARRPWSIMEVCGQHLHQEPTPLSTRGLAIPAELEAVVLACLNKDPNRRPQSALELRRRVEVCPVEPWDDDKALAWWREYQPDLDGLARQSTGDVGTIAVDGARRASAALTGSIN